MLAYGRNIHRYDKQYVKGEGKLNLVFFFSIVVIIWYYSFALFWQIWYFDNQGTVLQFSFILALTAQQTFVGLEDIFNMSSA